MTQTQNRCENRCKICIDGQGLITETVGFTLSTCDVFETWQLSCISWEGNPVPKVLNILEP